MPPPYGPSNPHPLSHLKTELVWEGKYDEYGNRREVDVAGAAMPLQKMRLLTSRARARSAWAMRKKRNSISISASIRRSYCLQRRMC